MFVDERTVRDSVARLQGSAGHLLKIWFALKYMGLQDGARPLSIDTSNSTPALKRLFSCGAEDGRFFIPFAHTPRYITMKHDAARSIVQTTIQRWGTSGSVVTCDPTDFLDITSTSNEGLTVAPSRRYPFGLGIDESGFALEDGSRVALPIVSFAAWYGRQTEIPDDRNATDYLVESMLSELHISSAERDLIFIDDDLQVSTQKTCLSDRALFALCEPFISGERQHTVELAHESFANYTRRVRSMVSGLSLPAWLRGRPDDDLRQLLADGARAVLLYGPPRTGKTRVIDLLVPRDDPKRSTIQLHDGWGYDHLVEGLKPDANGKWDWVPGPLKAALDAGKTFVVLEEINRTSIATALGEVFSLIEPAYRGSGHAVTLRSGKSFFVGPDVVFLMTMNTIDKSTEDVDDGLLGRVASVEYPPRVEDLHEMLSTNGVEESLRTRLAQLFTEIQSYYPLGHGYFADLSKGATPQSIVRHYRAHVRPVLVNYLGDLKGEDLAMIDNLVDELFAKS